MVTHLEERIPIAQILRAKGVPTSSQTHSMEQDTSGNLTTRLENFSKQVQLLILHFKLEVLQRMVKYPTTFLLVT